MVTPVLPLDGRRIGVTADRRWQEQADLLTKRGAEVVHGPTLRTIDLSSSDALRAATESVVERPPDVLVATTGMGLRMWLEAAGAWGCRAELDRALAGATVVARGAKAASAARAAGLVPAWQAPHETMDEIVEHLDTEGVSSQRVALQLFDPAAHSSTEALRGLAEELVELPVYQWELPADTGPARRLIAATVAGELDAVTFTSQPAVRQLFAIAEDQPGGSTSLRAAFNGSVTASCVGSVCAAAAREMGIERILWPEPPRLVAMVRQLEAALAPPTGESPGES